jgi:hypothetical protein
VVGGARLTRGRDVVESACYRPDLLDQLGLREGLLEYRRGFLEIHLAPGQQYRGCGNSYGEYHAAC